jgi:hypothetical protein
LLLPVPVWQSRGGKIRTVGLKVSHAIGIFNAFRCWYFFIIIMKRNLKGYIGVEIAEEIGRIY